MWSEFVEYYHSTALPNWQHTLSAWDSALPEGGEVLLKLLLALVLSSVIGIERERKGRPAGLRTHVLVCLGATLVLAVTELYAADWDAQGQRLGFDPGRVIQGVITGVGFLGAGTIMTVGGQPHGLTTAAMVWVSAMLGIAIGTGYYVVAVIATAVVVFAVVALKGVEKMLPVRSFYSIRLRLPYGQADQAQVDDGVLESCRCRIQHFRVRFLPKEGCAEYAYQMETRQPDNTGETLARLREHFPDALELDVDTFPGLRER